MRCKYKHLKSIINHSFQKKLYPLNVKIAYTYNKESRLPLQDMRHTKTETAVLQTIAVSNSISFRKSSSPMTHIIHSQ